MLYHFKKLTYILLFFLIKCGRLNFVDARRLWIMVFVNYGSTTMLGKVMKIFQVWGKGQQKNEFLSSSSHFEDSEQVLVL
ncbi:hypothetical protein OIU78_008882 [Salix suchowensis]|nr:hypothetical protein OIU78_008882 [Salix suchowensis]